MLASHQIVFTGKRLVSLRQVELAEPKATEVLVDIRCSLMSTGTENIAFNCDFELGSDWDQYVKYPFQPGYAAVGVVRSVGEGVAKVNVGDRVAIRVGHASSAVVPETQCHKIPDNLSYDDALWFALAKITFLGVRAARLQLGDHLAVIGAGPIGQMTLRWARNAGPGLISAIEMAETRRAAAEAGGADVVHIGTADVICKEYHDRKKPLPRVVIDTTGNHHVFASALGLAAKYGTVVLLGVSGHPEKQTLTSDVIRKGLTIVGVHDSQTPPEWPQEAIIQLFFSLAAAGRFPLEGLISHRFAAEDCVAAYRLSNTDRASTMGIVFDWMDGN